MTMEIYQPFLMSKLARRLDVRFIGAVPGRYTFPDRQAVSKNGVEVYACRMCSISTQSAVIIAPEPAASGESIAAHFEHFGIIHAKASRQLPNGFTMDLVMSEDQRATLAEQIKWQKRKARTLEPDKRVYPRIQPRDPCTLLSFADGTRVPCFVIDVSQSGAALSASILPVRGALVAVGSLIGRVIRRLDVGFAVQFTEVHEMGNLESLLAPPAAGS